MSPSVRLGPDEAARLRAALEGEGEELLEGKGRHEAWRTRDGSLILYGSGSLVFRGGGRARRLIELALGPSAGPGELLAGSDEAGKGEWYGPLVVGAVALEPEAVQEVRLAGVRDSKTLPAERMGALARRVRELASQAEVALVPPDEYNRRYAELSANGRSLNDLLAELHSRALHAVLDGLGGGRVLVVVDRFDEAKTARALAWLDPSRARLVQLEGGESEPAVAAASVLAKDAFDRAVAELEALHGVKLKGAVPADVPVDVVRAVGKHHFSNVAARLRAPHEPTQSQLSRWSA